MRQPRAPEGKYPRDCVFAHSPDCGQMQVGAVTEESPGMSRYARTVFTAAVAATLFGTGTVSAASVKVTPSGSHEGKS